MGSIDRSKTGLAKGASHAREASVQTLDRSDKHVSEPVGVALASVAEDTSTMKERHVLRNVTLVFAGADTDV